MQLCLKLVAQGSSKEAESPLSLSVAFSTRGLVFVILEEFDADEDISYF